MKKKTAFLFVSLLSAMIFNSGCGILSMPDQQQVTFSTLESIREMQSANGLNIGRITNDSGTSYKMRYQPGPSVIIDEYRPWADMPHVMTANILRTDFPSGKNVLNANIFCWETDTAARQVRFGVEWSFGRRNRTYRNIYVCDFSEMTAGGIASAFSQAVNLWENDIENVLIRGEADEE